MAGFNMSVLEIDQTFWIHIWLCDCNYQLLWVYVADRMICTAFTLREVALLGKVAVILCATTVSTTNC